LAFEYDPPSALSHFEPADLLGALSIGVVVLDAQLCVVYANGAAQDMLAFRVDQARGRPFGDFLTQSSGLITTLRRALESGECIAGRKAPVVRPSGSPRDPSALDVTITPLGNQVTGTHLLLEFADGTERHSISHENDLLAQPARQSARDPVSRVPLPRIPR
jgi:nitrogen-specific signal transduction histidine kinase